jgi:hypothetical protein
LLIKKENENIMGIKNNYGENKEGKRESKIGNK